MEWQYREASRASPMPSGTVTRENENIYRKSKDGVIIYNGLK